MRDKIYNAINDPKVTFFLFPTPSLMRFIADGEHEYVKAMTPEAKACLLEGKCLPVAKGDVMDLLDGKLKADRHWLMTTGEIRVAGAAEVVANSAVNKNPQGL